MSVIAYKRLRPLALVLLLLQLGLPVGVSAMELLQDDGSGALVVHVESEGSEDCGLHHDHRFCQVVRNLVQVQRSAPPPPLAVDRSGASSSPRPELRLLEHRSAWLQERHSSRAPPAA
ncbi:MAG: hypothetical protein P8188_01805 [Gemmatimonadota bacterium]